MNWSYLGTHGHYGVGVMGFWLIIIVLVIALVVYLLLKQQTTTRHSDESALEILDKRLARGEISTEEYYALKQVIQKD